jgi:hypothetical protein
LLSLDKNGNTIIPADIKTKIANSAPYIFYYLINFIQQTDQNEGNLESADDIKKIGITSRTNLFKVVASGEAESISRNIMKGSLFAWTTNGLPDFMQLPR